MPETIVDEADEEAVRLLVGNSALPTTGRVMAFRDAQGIRGAFLFEKYTGVGGSIHVHWAGRDGHWLKKYMLNLVAMYMFESLQCQISYGLVPAKATNVLDIDYRLGFREVYRLKGFYPEDDLVILQMRKEECIWLPERRFKETKNELLIRGRGRTQGTRLEEDVGSNPTLHRPEPGDFRPGDGVRKGPVH
jgi:hypothetical protein